MESSTSTAAMKLNPRAKGLAGARFVLQASAMCVGLCFSPLAFAAVPTLPGRGEEVAKAAGASPSEAAVSDRSCQ